jgi:hypothetical protein
MCPVCLATMGLYVAGGVSAGGITTYLATRVLLRQRDLHVGDRRVGVEVGKLRDSNPAHDGRPREA